MTRIIIAPDKEEKKAIKKHEKFLDLIRAEGDAPKRDEDLFIGGPMDGETCKHQPNGPKAHNDPKGFYADYYFMDKMNVDENNAHSRVLGYHLYSCLQGFHEAFDGEQRYVNKAEHKNGSKLGLRGPAFRKCYYYIGFIDDRILAIDGVILNEYYEIIKGNQ